ncbi:MAG: type 4a pilus biogenesis protein PilO [Deltaproteobacteria bacterium]|nr:type 4a pilus biogenesis protein PilO [Deltaproteobacteria bacterium]MBW2077608.1 type 4a pilus biogenesis protein PilO [Deltaproteobacteria bacterium]
MALDLSPYFDKIAGLKMIHRIIIFVGTVVVLVAAFVFLVYLPKTDEIKNLKADIEQLEGQIRLAAIRTKNLKKLESDLAGIEEDLKFALRLLPTSSEIPSLLKNITKLGNESNLDFLLFSPLKEIPKELYVEIPVSVEVRGNYHDVAQFFDKVGKLDRIVNVVDITMIPVKEFETNLRTVCKTVTYRFKEEKAKGATKKKK